MLKLPIGPLIAVLVVLVAPTLSGAETTCLNPALRALSAENDSLAIRQAKDCEQSPARSRLMGIAYCRLYQADSAHYYLQKAYKSGLDDDTVRVYLARALLWKKDMTWSGKLLDEVASTQWIPFMVTRALHLELSNHFDDALNLYDKVLDNDSLNYEAMVKKGELLSWMHLFDAALAQLDKAAHAGGIPNRLKVRAMVRRAQVLSWKKKFDEAHEALDSALMIDPENSEARLIKGEIQEWQGAFANAKNTYKQILLYDEDNREAKLRLGKLLWVK